MSIESAPEPSAQDEMHAAFEALTQTKSYFDHKYDVFDRDANGDYLDMRWINGFVDFQAGAQWQSTRQASPLVSVEMKRDGVTVTVTQGELLLSSGTFPYPVAPSDLHAAIMGTVPLVEPVYIGKALLAGMKARVSLAGGTGPKACVMLVNIQLTPWTHTKDTAEAFASGYNIALDQLRSSIMEVSALVANAAPMPFQQRVQPWMQACFGPVISADTKERNHRFFEESTELVQATGMTVSEAHQLVDYVYGRPAGEPAQEVGGVMVTLAALCLAQGMDMREAGETELARIWTKVEQIRAKQAAKPKHSPLPEAAPVQTAVAVPEAVKLAGAKMANTMFNLAQGERVITQDLRAQFKKMQVEWDAAIRDAHPQEPKP